MTTRFGADNIGIMPRIAAAFFLVTLLTSRGGAQVRERVRPNDNRARAGLFSGTVLALRMEARLAEWHPDGEDRPGAVVPVFAEIGRQASIPGPLIRVPAGSEVITVVRNAVPNTILTLHGLHARPVVGAAFNDSVQLTYGQIQTLRFRLDRPGTYYYWGTTTGASFGNRTHDDAQLNGAIVVDEKDERAPKDRILMIGMWADTAASELTRHRTRQLFVMNGRAWPNADRLQYEKGELVQWRVINATADVHAMHLHGFNFRVRRRGDGKADTVFGAKGDYVNTERMVPGEAMLIAWNADRLGNWLFHCQIPGHSAQRGPLGYPLQQSLAQAGELRTATAGLGGLISGVEVKRAEDDTSAVVPGTAAPPTPISTTNARRLRMLLRQNIGSTPARPLYGVAFADRSAALPEPPEETGQRVGPTLVLNREEPVSITVLNRIGEPTSIHWHGIGLESYFDGVPGFSGVRPQVAPAIAPADSFEYQFTPSRAGTFIYHSHVNEPRQIRGGVAGVAIVAERGRYDATKDIAIVLSSPSDSLDEERAVLINGAMQPTALQVRRGVATRLRFANITTGRPELRVELHQSVGADTATAMWRPIARAGMDIPVAERTLRPARQILTIGETADFELTAARPGEYRLEVKTPMGVVLGAMTVRVQ